MLAALASGLALTAQSVESSGAVWKVKATQFSALSIGIVFEDDKTGWSSFTDGSSSIQIVKTEDGGAIWNPVKNDTNNLMVLGMASTKKPDASNIAVTGMANTKFSVDAAGETFRGSKGAPFISQSIRAAGKGRYVIAAADSVCVSKDEGASYKCNKVPFAQSGTGRYASMPTEKTIYVTAGMWPSAETPQPDVFEVTSQLRVAQRKFALSKNATVRVETGPLARSVSTPNAGYTAEIWKSSDGGVTWEQLMNGDGNFYFNEIDCFSSTHCVAVAEGFAQDGSDAPGARVYVTTDGKTFKLAHHEKTNGASLMAAKMLSETDHHVGGGGMPKGGILALHTTDGGATYEDVGGGIMGNSITSLDFISAGHGFATTVNVLQICSLLEFGSA